MIVPVSAGTGVPSDMFAPTPGSPDEANQLMAIAQLKAEGRLQAQSADEAAQSHKSIAQQLKGKVG